MRVFFAVTILLAAVYAEEEYLPPLEGMQSLTITWDTPEKFVLLKNYENVPGFDFIKFGSNSADVLVTADHLEKFKAILEENNIKYSVTVENVKEQVLEEQKAQEYARKIQERLQRFSPRGQLSFKYYPEVDEINNYLEYISNTYNDVAKVIDVGKSYEGRTVKGLKISKDGKDKPTVFIDGGIHAREWIAPVTGLYIIDQLVANQTNRYLLENVNWLIVPLVNPDGYQYTHSEYRLWRKTRSVQEGTSCLGVDGNRNYDMAWMVVGASSNPCSDTYAGPKAFSEPETRNIRDVILGQNGNVKVYISLHSYGQYILYPWGYTNDVPDNEEEHRNLAAVCADAIASSRNTKYTYGTSGNHLYLSSGGSDDWALDKGGADLAYTYELPGGLTGFILPPSQIIPVGIETFQAIIKIESHVNKKYSQES